MGDRQADFSKRLHRAWIGLTYAIGVRRGTLSGQTIRALDIFEPFVERTVHSCGMSYGLSCAGYDIRIREDVELWPGRFVRASSIERFNLPTNVIAKISDKSTLARHGLSMFNTVAEPGWHGYLTLELSNKGQEMLRLQAGQPIAQVLLEFTDRHVERPYSGKYQGQPPRPVEPLREAA